MTNTNVSRATKQTFIFCLINSNMIQQTSQKHLKSRLARDSFGGQFQEM